MECYLCKTEQPTHLTEIGSQECMDVSACHARLRAMYPASADFFRATVERADGIHNQGCDPCACVCYEAAERACAWCGSIRPSAELHPTSGECLDSCHPWHERQA